MPHTCYLIRPDQHVCARWRTVDAAALAQALQRATGHEPIIAIPIATTNETWADLGRPAPSSFATRVETAELRVTGIVYNNDVVWMTMAAVANAVCGSRR